MREQAQLSRAEIENTIAQLESIMVNLKRQATDQPEAIKNAFLPLNKPDSDFLSFAQSK